MSVQNGSQQDVDIDLGALFRAIWRRRTRVLLVTVAVAGLAFAGANLMAPRYESEARLLIESREPEFSAATPPPPSSTAFDESGIASEVQVLRSIDLIKQVARNMKLYELKEFDPTADPSAISDLLVMLGLKQNPLDLPPEERVLATFQEKLQVYQVEKSRVIAIQFSSKDRRLAAAIPNEMAKIYLSLQSGAKLDSNSEATRWLEPEIANLREKVRLAEEKVASYRSQSDLLGGGDQGNFATRQMTDLSTELARVRGERANAEARAENVRAALKSGRGAETLNDVVGSQMIQRLKESESQIQSQIADLSVTLLDGHPRLKGLKSQLQGIRGQIRAETEKILASLQNEAKVGELREEQLTRQLNTLKASTAKAGEDEVGLRALEREATAQRQLLETYLARYREATSRTGASAAPADARIISNAVEPTEAAFPKVLPITIVAALATFLIASIVILLSELFSGRALRPVGAVAPVAVPKAKAERQPKPSRETPAPVAAPAPIAAPSPVAPALAEEPVVEEGFAVEDVAETLVAARVPVAVCVEPDSDAGSDNTVLLARILAEAGHRVVLIDLTGTGRPTRLMAMSADLPGITDLLAGDVAFSDTIHGDRHSEAHLLPQGTADAAQAMRAVDRLPIVIEALSNAYDLVLIDCGKAASGAVARIARDEETDIILSAPEVDPESLVLAIEDFAEAGYRNIHVMTGSTGGSAGRRPRAA